MPINNCTCIICLKGFHRSPSQVEQAVFCSRECQRLFYGTTTPPRSISEQSRTNMSKSHKGKPLSPKHRAAISISLKGIDRGGKKAPSYARMRDPRYREWRWKVLERDLFTCQECGKVSSKGRGLHAHHINRWSEFEDLRYDTSNGVTLCTKHHREREGGYVGKEVNVPDLIPCACGCGTLIESVDMNGKPRRFVNYHTRRGAILSPKTREQISHSLLRNSKMTETEFIQAYNIMWPHDVAKKFGVSMNTVTRWAKKLGLPPYDKAER